LSVAKGYEAPRHAVCSVVLNLHSQVGFCLRAPPWPQPIA
jgi:hypothetical protein